MFVQWNFYYYCNEQCVIIQSKERRLPVSSSLSQDFSKFSLLNYLSIYSINNPLPVNPRQNPLTLSVRQDFSQHFSQHISQPIKPDTIL